MRGTQGTISEATTTASMLGRTIEAKVTSTGSKKKRSLNVLKGEKLWPSASKPKNAKWNMCGVKR